MPREYNVEGVTWWQAIEVRSNDITNRADQ